MSTWRHLTSSVARETDAAAAPHTPLDTRVSEGVERVLWGGRCGKPSDVSSDSYTWGRPDAAPPRPAVPRRMREGDSDMCVS